MKIVTGFFMAWGNFCAIPCPYRKWDEKSRKYMLYTFPLLGFFIGLIWYGLWWFMDWISLPLVLQSGVLAAYPFLVTGFIHLDGYIDCNDAILSRKPMEEKQRILKDSHAGAMGVIAFGIMLLMFFAAIWGLLERNSDMTMAFFIVIPVLSRMVSVIMLQRNSTIETSQYNGTVSGDDTIYLEIVYVAVTIVIIILSMMLGVSSDVTLLPVVATILAGFISQDRARKQLGGMNGDVAGYGLVWAEFIGVLCMAVLL